MQCIIIEDELPAQIILKSYIAKFPKLKLIGTFQTAMAAHGFLKQNQIDLIFLDINLPDISGLDFIKTVKNPPKIIVTTAYPNYAVDSFYLDTIVDYLVKPFALNRFLKAISKAEKINYSKEVVEPTQHIFLNVDKTLHKVALQDLLYIESDRNYLHFITTSKKILVLDSLKNWKENLALNNFVQVHKSYLINLSKIEKITGNTVYVNGSKIPIGRTYKKILMEKL